MRPGFFLHWFTLSYKDKRYIGVRGTLSLPCYNAILNRFVPSAPFLYPLKTSEGYKVF